MHSDDAGRFGIKAGAVPRRNASVDVLNPLLRMAIITGVDSAVALHISRGDNLNASRQRKYPTGAASLLT